MHGGKREGAGRPKKAESMGLTALLNECWEEDARRECITKLASMARGGDLDAMKLLMAYTFGKPKEKVELQGGVRIEVVYVDDAAMGDDNAAAASDADADGDADDDADADADADDAG